MPELKLLLKIEGPPGSGKTRLLAREACRLVVEEGLSPDQVLILAMTPLNKRRLQAYLKIEAAQASLQNNGFEVLTWEEWLLRFLNNFQPETLHTVRVLPDVDARILLQEVLRQRIQPGDAWYHASRQSSFAGVFYELIRQLQLQGVTESQLDTLVASASYGEEGRVALVADVFRGFQQRLKAANLLCHPELLQQATERLHENSTPLSSRYKAILVDEAQELSQTQHNFLAGLPISLIMAGQEHLSIRSFRGATPELFKTLAAYKTHRTTFLPQQACLRNNEAILTLLKGFLSVPIWEEQQPHLEQLEHMVQFGLFRDAEDEAEGVAHWIARFVATAQVDDRSARWDDCVILLRSSHYQPSIVQALLQQGIPFRSEVLSDPLIRFQHFYYDLLQVFKALETLAITPDKMQSAQTLQAHVNTMSLTLLQQKDIFQACNRHLLRWLECAVPDQSQAGLAGFQTESQEEESWLLPSLLEGQSVSPPVFEAIRALIGLYQYYSEDYCPLGLLNSVAGLFQATDEDAGELQSGLEACRQNLERLNGHYNQVFGQPLPLAEILSGFTSLWDGSEAVANAAIEGGAVRLLSIHQVQGETFPLVAIPFLVSGEFPYTRDITEVISEEEQQLLGLDVAYRVEEVEEARLLAVGMSRASHQLLLSCHEASEGNPVLTSVFYQRLLNQKRLLLEQPVSAGYCLVSTLAADACDLAFCHYHADSPQCLSLDNDGEDGLFTRYVGESAWAELEMSHPEPLFEADDTVYLNASSIKTYMTCPRQFYYKHLLRLPQPGSEAASLGSLIHRVMEVFNTQAATKPYTAERLKTLAECMFLFQTDPEGFFESGFREDDLHELLKLSPLMLATLRERLMASVDDLARKGYFDRYGNLRQVQPERQLEGFQLEGIERCRFSGTVDALIQTAEGHWDILDYKTFRNAYSVGVDTCEKRFRETLDPLPEEEDLTHAERFDPKLNPAYPKDYQLPLYYLACDQDPSYRGHLDAVALQIVRPGFVDNPMQGAIRLEISANEIEMHKAQMIADIRRYIVEPILESSAFETNPNRMSCGHCAYYGICDVDGGSEEATDA